MTRTRNIVVLRRAVFADIPVIPTPTTASSMGRGQITVIASTDARKAARPALPATMNTQIIPILMASGRA